MIDLPVFIKDLSQPQKEINIINQEQVVKVSSEIHFTNILVWGDIVNKEVLNSEQIHSEEFPNVLKKLKGHFIIIREKHSEHKIEAGCSLFSLLPLYYYYNSNQLIITCSLSKMSKFISNKSVNKRFILENIVFNYNLFDNTFYNEIKLLPVFTTLSISDNKLSLKKYLEIENFFVSNPTPWKKSTKKISENFIQIVKEYLPNDNYSLSLTGGFDGRTLASCSLYYKKDFVTYSFGAEATPDVKIAKELSALAGIKFTPIYLDSYYVQNESLSNGLEFILNSDGGASFSRAHYLYAVKQILKQNNIIVTGNFGSELFRAAHIAGVVINKNLYSLFQLKNIDEVKKNILLSQELSRLNSDYFKDEIDSLIQDLNKLMLSGNSNNSLTINMKFYKMIFEVVFRKYFGAELINQFHYLINRTPFLDFDFLRTLLTTELSGVYSDFFEKNPVKRFKGQVLYAEIIKNTFPDYLKITSDKGYAPDALLNHYGKIKLLKSFLYKRILKNRINSDTNSVNDSFKMNKNYFKKIKFDEQIFNRAVIDNEITNYQLSSSLFIAISQAYYHNNRIEND